MSNITSLQIGQNKIQIGKRVLLDSIIDGNKTCDIYSDGYCVQTGISTSATTSGVTDTLLRNYRDTNYKVFVSPNSGGWYATYGYGATIIDTSTIKIYSSNSKDKRPTRWIALGYINLED